MRYLSWLLGITLFVLALGFAIKNSDPVTLNYYLGFQWQAPLVLMLLVFLGAGMAIGVAATLGFVFRQRREILLLKRELRLKNQALDDKRPDSGKDE